MTRLFHVAVVAGCLSLMPMPQPVVAGADGEPDSRRATAGERVLHFPADRSLGIVYTRPLQKSDDVLKQLDDWERLGEARGDVRVRKNAEVQLAVGGVAAKDLSPLDRLPVDGVQSIELRGTQVNDGQLKHVGRLTGLHYVGLHSARITDVGIKQLSGLVNLRSIELSAFGVNREGFGVGDEGVAVLAKLPQLADVSLRLTKVTDAGMVHLGKMKSLKILSVSGSRVTDAGLVHLKHVKSLEILDLGVYEEGKNFTDAGVEHVAGLTNLKWLRLGGTQLSDAGLRHLSGLTRLEHLEINDTKVTSAGLKALKPLTSLKALWLPDGINDEGAKRLSELPSLQRIPSNFFALTDAGLAHLSSLKRLENISIGGPKITDEGLRHLAKMESLKYLTIQLSPVTDAGMAYVALCPRLEFVSLYQTDVTADSLEHLRELPLLEMLSIHLKGKAELKHLQGFPALTHLTLGGDSLTNDQLKYVDGLKNLDSLEIRGLVVDDSGIKHLAGLSRLTRLDITASAITDAGMASLAKLDRLEYLTISGLITDRGLDHLAKLKSLKYLQVASPFLTDEGTDRLQRNLPSLQQVHRFRYSHHGRGPATFNPRDGIFRDGEAAKRAKKDALEGHPPPALQVDGWVNTDGKALRLEDLKGKVVLLDFWGRERPHSIAAMEKLKELHAECSGRGLVVIGIHTSAWPDGMAEFVKAREIPWPVAYDIDNATTKAYSVSSPPALYLIDRVGKLRIADVHDADLQKAVKLLLAE